MEKIKSLLYSVVDLVKPRGIPRNINGTIIRFPARWSRYFEGHYEKSNFTFASKSVPKEGTVIDIGAHIGLYSVFFSQLVGEKGKVYCFEPSPFTFRVLKKIIHLNRNYGGEMNAIPHAVSSKAGEATFNISPNSASLANTLAPLTNTVPVPVRLVSIDEFRNDHNLKIDFLKIDAEGAEYDILLGAKQTFELDKPKAYLGLHPWQLKELGASLKKIWDLLVQYRLKVEMAGVPVSEEWFCSQSDLFDIELTPA